MGLPILTPISASQTVLKKPKSSPRWRYGVHGETPLKKVLLWSVGVHVLGPPIVIPLLILLAILIGMIMGLPIWDWFKPKDTPEVQISFISASKPQEAPPKEAEAVGDENQTSGGKSSERHHAPKSQKPLPKPKPTPLNPFKKDLTQVPLKEEPKADKEPDPLEDVLENEDVVSLNLDDEYEEWLEPDGWMEENTGKDADTRPAIQKMVLGKYFKGMREALKKNWHPPRGKDSEKVTVVFVIEKDGHVSSVTVKEPSGNDELDEAAIATVEQSAPFEPLPADYESDTLPVLFTFDYTVLGFSKRKHN